MSFSKLILILLSVFGLAHLGNCAKAKASKPLRGARGRSIEDQSYCYGDSPDCGEDTWPGLCKTGENQSPIDLPSIGSLTEVGIVDGFQSAGHVLNGFTLLEDGLNLNLFPLEDDPILDLTFKFSPLNRTYQFNSINFHWSQKDDCGSEHYIEGKGFAMEMHVVYYRADYDSIDTAMEDENAVDSLASVAIFFENDETVKSCNTLKPLLNGIEKLVSEDLESGMVYDSEDKLNLDKFLRFNKAYWYLGSFAKPPCRQNVVWIINPTPIKISGEDLAVFRKLKAADGQPTKFAHRKIGPIKKHIVHRVGVQYITNL